MSGRPSPSEALERAEALLRARGWVARNAAAGGVMGDEEGPLTVTQALWQGGRYGNGLVHPPATSGACRMLCLALGLDRDSSFVQLGLWCRQPGRTQEQVLALFRKAKRDAANRLLTFIREAADDEQEAPDA